MWLSDALGRGHISADERSQAHALASLIGWKQDHQVRTPTATNQGSERVRLTSFVRGYMAAALEADGPWM